MNIPAVQLTPNLVSVSQIAQIQKLREYRRLWIWLGQHKDRLDDSDDDEVQEKWEALIHIEEELLRSISTEQLVRARK